MSKMVKQSNSSIIDVLRTLQNSVKRVPGQEIGASGKTGSDSGEEEDPKQLLN